MRFAMSMLSFPLTAAVCLAPLPALADGSIAAFQLRAPLAQAPLGLRLQQYVTLQEPLAGEAPVAQPAPPPIEGSAGGTVEGPPPAQPYPPPGTYPPGTYPPGAYPPGAYPPGYYPPVQPSPPSRGLGLLISGAAVTGAVGLPLTIYGGYIVALGRQYEDGSGASTTVGNFVGGFFLVFGVIGLATGITLLAIGGVKMKKYNDWKAGRQVSLAPGGLRIQF